MNKAQNTASADKLDDGEYGVMDILIVLAKNKKLIVALPLAMAIFSAALSMTLPNIYRANTKLLPPQQAQSGAAALLSQVGGFAGAASVAAGIKNPNDLYVGMLKSRTIADKLVTQFDLKKVYGTNSQEIARRKLEANTNITSGKDGIMTIDVEDENQGLVARLANAYVDELLSLTKVLAVTEASQRRIFFERQLELSKNNLATAEMTLKGALDTRGVISVDSDSRAIVETVARLRAQISAKEIQLGAMRAFITTSNPTYSRAQEELNSLRTELLKLENGRIDTPGQQTSQSSNKQVGLENIKILRDVKYYQMLYELLAKQYEAARLDEAKDASIIQVLDVAVEPERNFKPKRLYIVLLASAAALLLAIIASFIFETKRRVLRSSKGPEQLFQLKAYLSSNRKTEK